MRGLMLSAAVLLVLAMVAVLAAGPRETPVAGGPVPPGAGETAGYEGVAREGPLPALGPTAGSPVQPGQPDEPARATAAPNEQEPYILRKEIPILMYHEIGTPAGPWKGLYVEPEVFAGQLDWLKDHGYTTVGLKDIYDHWFNQKPLPEKTVVLTFDDGYPSVYQTVFPLLAARKMRATFFLYPAKLNTAKGLTGEMVAELARAGMEIGSHTYSHVDLTRLDGKGLERELAGSGAALESITSEPVEFLAFPAGGFNREVVAKARAAGYQGAVTTRYGMASPEQNSYEWKRVRVNNEDGVKGLARKLTD